MCRSTRVGGCERDTKVRCKSPGRDASDQYRRAVKNLNGSVLIDPYTFVSALNGIWAQRLLRRVCHVCAEPTEASSSAQQGRHYKKWVSLSNASSPTGASYISVHIYAPDWSYVGGTSVAPGGTASVDLPALPSSGAYKVNFSAGPPGRFSVQALLAPR